MPSSDANEVRYGRRCLVHALELDHLAGEQGKRSLHEIVQKVREELEHQRRGLLLNSRGPASARAGVLGKAAAKATIVDSPGDFTLPAIFQQDGTAA